MLTFDLATLGLQKGDRVLDVGCGTGRHTHGMYAALPCHVVGLDRDFTNVSTTLQGFYDYPVPRPVGQKSHFTLMAGNAYRLPFKDGCFDTVVCSEVLEHLDDYTRALREIHRVLKPNGTLMVSVPRFWPEWICWQLSKEYQNTPGGHVRIFRTRQLKNAVKQQGFHFRCRHWSHGLHIPYWIGKCAFGVNKQENLLLRMLHKFLVWDVMKSPLLTRFLSVMLDPLMGKSVVLYFRKNAT